VEFLRQKRIEAGLTQAQAGRKIGRQGSTWSQYEQGLILPDLKRFGRMVTVLNCDASELLRALLRGYSGSASVTNLHAERAKRRRG
jgi:transcriptional regulator with XRE-family HTH domain